MIIPNQGEQCSQKQPFKPLELELYQLPEKLVLQLYTIKFGHVTNIWDFPQITSRVHENAL